MTYQSRSPHEQEPPQVITSSKGRLQTKDVPEDAREASYEASKTTAENVGAATEELKDRQDRLTGATAALIVAVREAGEGLWEAGSGPMEGALLGLLEEQIDWMEDLKESLDQKRRELGAGKLGAGLGPARRAVPRGVQGHVPGQEREARHGMETAGTAGMETEDGDAGRV